MRKRNAIFLSVFTDTSNWNKLVTLLSTKLNDCGAKANSALVFLSFERGCSVQVVLNANRNQNIYHDIIRMETLEFLDQCTPMETTDPISSSSFFLDFPGNQIRYNLFDEHWIKEGRLAEVQLILSAIIVKRFSERPFTQTSLLALVDRLAQSIKKESTLLGNKTHAASYSLQSTESLKLSGFRHLQKHQVSNMSDLYEVPFASLVTMFGRACLRYLLEYENKELALSQIWDLVQLHLVQPSHTKFNEAYERANKAWRITFNTSKMKIC
ncbi:hypothetical protein ACX0G7_10505 [Flavitalea antarctica]